MPKQTSPAEAEYYTVPEVAQKLAVSTMTVYRRCQNGDIPTLRLGRSYRIPRQALEELLASRTTGGAP